METKMFRFCSTIILLAGLVTACGGGGGGSDGASGGDTGGGGTTTSTGIYTGVAVDPYIVNAQFEELDATGQTVIQRSSESSGATGEFSFPNAIQDGSIIRIKTSAKGLHANAPYAGVIKRQVVIGDQQPVVVSPLTTLLANGMSPAAVIQTMSSAGLHGLSEASLHADPMAPLLNRSGSVTEAELAPLQANMAINAFMEATQNFNFNGSSPAGTPVNLTDIVFVVRETLNPTLFQQMAGTIGSDFTVGDMAETSATLCRTVVSQIRAEVAAGSSAVPPATIDQFLLNAMGDTHMIAGEIYQRRTGHGGTMPPPVTLPDGQTTFTNNCAGCHTAGTGTGFMDLAGDGATVTTRFSGGASHNGRTLAAEEITAVASYLNGLSAPTPVPNPTPTPTPDPGTGGGSTPPADGQALFTNNCAGCHTAGTGSGFMDLAGDGAMVTTRFSGGASHNGRTLAAEEITAVASYLNGLSAPTPPPTPDPGTGGGSTPPNGGSLYAAECQGCHGSLQTSDIGNRTATGIQAAIDANLGGMGSLVLTAAEVQAIADTLAATAPPPPPPAPPQDRTGQQVYDQECAGCHALGTHDTSGTIDLAGTGATIITRIQGGHNGKVLTATELNALAAFADTFAPATGGGGTPPPPPPAACDSCHGQPPAGSSYPNTAGAHGVHTALSNVGTDCANCHSGATHNNWVDLKFPATWNAKSGAATDNLDGTCSNISCHGGQKTPLWGTGSINVDTQCRTCHTSGTTQYNSYFSGEHRKHVIDKGLDCLVCHDAAKLRNGHFSNLATATFEQAPASTIKTSLSYSGGTCLTAGCHGSKRW